MAKQQKEQRATMVYYGPWLLPIACKHVLCTDGKRRYARITGDPDTYFSIPASVQVQGSTVSGYITSREYPNENDAEFHAVWTGKNAALLLPQNERARYEEWKKEQHKEHNDGKH
jgi:hypothetical protein